MGKNIEVLFERETEDGVYEGKTENYVTVKVKSETDISGKILKVSANENINGIIYGELI